MEILLYYRYINYPENVSIKLTLYMLTCAFLFFIREFILMAQFLLQENIIFFILHLIWELGSLSKVLLRFDGFFMGYSTL